MSKYGLQLRVKPQQKKQPTRPPLPTPLGFNDDDEDNVERDILRQNYKNKTHKDIEEQHKKALEEDPSAFDYDGVYDEMKEKQVRPKEQDRQDRKPRYIKALMDKAKQREREHEIIYERKLAKERDQDEHLYADKDKFVTSAYKRKLAEQAKWMEEERLRELREEKEDVTKKKDITDFYFNLAKNVAFGAGDADKSKPKKPHEEVVIQPQGEASSRETGTDSESSEIVKSHGKEIAEDPSPKEKSKPPHTISDASTQPQVKNDESASNQPTVDSQETSENAVPSPKDHHKRNEDAVAAAKERFLARKKAKLTPLVLHQIYLLLLLHFTTHIFSVAGSYSRANFPVDFVFGSGTAAPQYEGAAFEDGRTPSIWDTFAGGAEGNVGCDGYHKYKGDVKLMVDLGLEAFRISISWSRLIPDGRGPINAKGLHYYNNLINELINNGIQPHVTLSHLDLPQALHDKYGGWLNRTIVKDFVEYANVCFKEFGDRVLHWTTLNEVNIAALGGYGQGIIPPGRCSARSTCTAGDSTTEPYTVMHNMLLAHSAAAKLYKENYKGIQNGKIGLNIYASGIVPYTNSDEDVMAAQRAKDFYIGWVLDPLVFGDYPDIVKKRAQTRIPAFTRLESEQVKGSLDFIGLNHYTTISVKDDPTEHDINDFIADMAVETIFENEGGTITDFQYYPLMPWGFIGVLEYIKDVYGNPPIYIQENGQITPRDGALNDTVRVDYLQAYIGALLDAVRNGSSIKGYFEWTLLDCVELLNAYATSFGLYYVDLDETELTRYQKLSARWYSSFLKGNVITQGGEYTTSFSSR